MQIIHLDISNKGVIPTVYAKQGDVGRKFQVVLTDSGVPYVPASGSAFSAWYSGASGDGNYTDIGEKSAFSVNGNKVTVEMITQMLSAPGNGVLCLVLNQENGVQIASWNIPYICESIPGYDSESAKEYYTAFSEAVSKIKETDSTLTKAGFPADAKKTGDQLANKVPITRTINNKKLNSNITLSANDVGARPKTWLPTIEEIGAAPAGYGLGNNFTTATKPEQVDGYKACGWYRYVPNDGTELVPGTGITYAGIRVDSYSADGISVQTAYPAASYPGSLLRRYYTGGAWSEWEWVNPPMVPGVEYRTVERYNGKVVYAMTVNAGGMVASGTMPISISGAADIGIVRYVATMGGHALPLNAYGVWTDLQVLSTASLQLRMRCDTASLVGGSVKVYMWYTKD